MSCSRTIQRVSVALGSRVFRMPTLDEALASFPQIVFNVDAQQTAPDMISALLRAIEEAPVGFGQAVRRRSDQIDAKNLVSGGAMFAGMLSPHAPPSMVGPFALPSLSTAMKTGTDAAL